MAHAVFTAGYTCQTILGSLGYKINNVGDMQQDMLLANEPE